MVFFTKSTKGLLFSIIVITYIINNVTSVYCPYYCRCLISNRLRHVQCIGRGLISVDLDVPHSVQWLQLSNNSIYDLKDNIFENLGLKHIVELNLDKNSIQSIELNAFSGLTQMRAIDLSDNHLYSIPPGLFENIPSLVFVFLNGNPLRYLKRNHTFLISPSIRVLDISNCRISYIPELALSALPGLRRLNISSNHIESLDHHSFADLSYLEEIDISKNMIVCGTTIEEFLMWSSSKSIKILGTFCKQSTTPPPNVKTMEKMIMLDEIENSRPIFEDIAPYSNSECICPKCDSKDVASEDTTTEVVTVQEKNYIGDYISLFLVLSFISGFVIGIAVTVSFWICNRLFRSRRRIRMCYTTMTPDYPPPAYTDLYRN